MAYKPFLVSNMRHGLDESVEPWLLPQDAFQELHNCHLRRGVIEKRNGYSEFDRMVYSVDDESIGASGSTNYAGTLSNTDLRAGDLSFTDGTQTIVDDGDGTLSGDGTGTITYATGVYDVTFTVTTTGAVTADYIYYPGNSMTGIHTYVENTGTEEFIIFDTKRAASYNSANLEFDPIGSSNVWTGGDTDFMWVENYKNLLFMTNNVDRLKVYNGSTITNVNVDFDDDATNEVDKCLMCFAYKERLVLLATTEDGTNFPQRARWPAAGSTTNWIDNENGGTGGYVDAPTTDWIVSADFVGDDLVVFFERSVWRLKYTGNATLPFRWERIHPGDGGFATHATISIDDRLVTLSASKMIATDGLEVYRVDDKNPEIVQGINQEKLDVVFSAVVEEYERAIILYPDVGQDTSDSAIIYNYADNAMSTYDYAFNVLGYYKETSDFTLDDIDETFDELEYSFDSKSKQAGFPKTIAGDASGYLYKLDDGASDDGSAINFYATTGRLNPYIEQGMQARLGFVDFLVDIDSATTIYVDFYINRDTSSYLTNSFVCDRDDDTTGKVWKRVYVNCVGESHKMKIRNNATGQTPRIHAIQYWFSPAGKII